jgi:hypothetical protein
VQGVQTEKGQLAAKGNFHFKENSSDAKNATSYTKAEAEAMVDGIMENLFVSDDYGGVWTSGELKNRAAVIKQAHAVLNGAEAGKRFGEALKFADYIIDSGKDNGKLDFGVREKLIRLDPNARAEHIRRINNDTISRGNVDDSIAGRIRSRSADNSDSVRRQSNRPQLQITQRESRHNEIGIPSKNEESAKRIKYSLKDNLGNELSSTDDGNERYRTIYDKRQRDFSLCRFVCEPYVDLRSRAANTDCRWRVSSISLSEVSKRDFLLVYNCAVLFYCCLQLFK